MTRRGVTEAAYFWARVDRTTTPDGCWEWTAGRTTKGYGLFSGSRGRRYAHRFSWELHNGPIPSGTLACHACDNPSCVRPDHLFLGTSGDNALDRDRKRRGNHSGRTHCLLAGHPLEGDNLYLDPRGKRGCKECRRQQTRASRARRRAA